MEDGCIRMVVEVESLPDMGPSAPDIDGQVADRRLLADALATLEPGQRALIVARRVLALGR
jgi:hypothetical protein